EVVLSEAQARADRLDVATRVLDPRRRVRGEVGVLLEDFVLRHERLELDEVTALAGVDMERVEGLHPMELFRPEVRLAERRHAEVDEGQLERRRAEAARGHARRCGIGAHDPSVRSWLGLRLSTRDWRRPRPAIRPRTRSTRTVVIARLTPGSSPCSESIASAAARWKSKNSAPRSRDSQPTCRTSH